MFSSGMMTYLKKAFLYHWNLLGFGTGIAFGALTPYPDVVLPLIVAGELLYLSILSTNPGFQRYVDALNCRANPGQAPLHNKTQEILNALSNADRRKFDQLTTLCLELRRIAAHQDIDQEPIPESIAKVQMVGINRLLWIYLKLLYAKNALENYFKTIDKTAIEAKIERNVKRLANLGPEAELHGMDHERWTTLSDTIATARSRLANYNKAVTHYEFIELELERLYTKIAGLAEMGISRQDPRTIISEIDLASDSVQQTETAINDLEAFTDIPLGDLEPPNFLEPRNGEAF